MIHLQCWRTESVFFTIPQIYSIASTTCKSRLSHRVAVQMILLKRCLDLMYVVYMVNSFMQKVKHRQHAVSS